MYVLYHSNKILTSPYSSLYEIQVVIPGNLPFFLIGTQPIPNSEAINIENKNPLASKPTTHSISGQCFFI